MTEQQGPDDLRAVVKEEYVDNQATGVEVEEEGQNEVQPWDPERIRVHTKHFSLRQVVDMIQEGDIDLAPDFQRLYVWKDWQKCSLIESVLLGIPLPTFYFNEDIGGKMQVVDGLQRLTTIFDFVRKGVFTLGGLDYLSDLNGAGYAQLSPTFKRRISNTQLVVHVIDPQTPYRVKFDIFRRINTGGSPLSAQEIRHCMSRDRSRDLLRRLSNSDSFIRATGGSLVNHIRMADREAVLRFCAFSILGIDGYGSSGLDAFLSRATESLDEPTNLTDQDLSALEARFHSAMHNAHAVFGSHAFRKWPLGNERGNPINRALLEVWAVILGQYDEELVIARAAELALAARKLMTEDLDFLDAISQGTGDPARVRLRFSRVEAVAKLVLA